MKLEKQVQNSTVTDTDSKVETEITLGPPLRDHIYQLRCNTQRLNTGLYRPIQRQLNVDRL